MAEAAKSRAGAGLPRRPAVAQPDRPALPSAAVSPVIALSLMKSRRFVSRPRCDELLALLIGRFLSARLGLLARILAPSGS